VLGVGELGVWIARRLDSSAFGGLGLLEGSLGRARPLEGSAVGGLGPWRAWSLWRAPEVSGFGSLGLWRASFGGLALEGSHRIGGLALDRRARF
jgi:hypothetical protein